jgi:hypothetical protein
MLSLLAAAVLAAAPAPSPGCVHAGEQVVVRSADVVVVRGARHGGRYSWARPYFGCLRATGRRVRIAADGAIDTGAAFRNRTFAIGGTFVAWRQLQYGRDSTDALIEVRDLRGRQTHAWSVDADALPTAIVVDPAGRTAYASPAGVSVLDGVIVRRVDRGVVAGLGIEGEDVVWSHAGEARSAPLAPPVDGCVPERDTFAPSATSEAVLAQRNSGVGVDNRTDMLACLRATGMFVTVGVHRARTAGNIAAAEQPDGTIVAVDLVSLTRVGGAPAIDPVYDRWDVLPDGTIVVGHPSPTSTAGTLTAYLPDGRVVPLGHGKVVDRDRLLLDDVTRSVTWDTIRGVVPL